MLFVQDKAEAITPIDQSEDISKQDLLSIKETLSSDREREELEKIKEDREEYQEVRTLALINTLHCCVTNFPCSTQDLRELEIEDKEHILRESVGSARLGKKVDKLIKQIERKLEAEPETPPDRQKIDADGFVVSF